jgi:hypothetical protein
MQSIELSVFCIILYLNLTPGCQGVKYKILFYLCQPLCYFFSILLYIFRVTFSFRSLLRLILSKHSLRALCLL